MIKQILHIFLLLLIFALTGCGEQSNTGDDKIETGNQNNQTIAIQPDTIDEAGNESESNSSGWGSVIEPLTINYEPMELEMFNDIINGAQPFYDFLVSIVKYGVNPDDSYRVLFEIGNISAYQTLSEWPSFHALLEFTYDSSHPTLGAYTANLNVSQMMPILNFIQSESDFFFNHDEFMGLELPVTRQTGHLGNEKKRLCISTISNTSGPNYGYDGYLISKGVNELEPDTPLYDLLQLIETEYIPLIIQESDNYWSEEDLVWEL